MTDQDKPQPTYYMRDNNTFRPLPENVEGALVAIREELDAGFRHGLLCSKRKNAPEPINFGSGDVYFWLRVEKWLKERIAATAPTQPEPERDTAAPFIQVVAQLDNAWKAYKSMALANKYEPEAEVISYMIGLLMKHTERARAALERK